MELNDLQSSWESFAQTKPLWAIFGWPADDIEGFFLTGEQEIKSVMTYIKSLDLAIPQGKALDFGCGIGRLTQPLCHYFDEVYGVDIAPTMIELANQYNHFGDRCHYFLNEREDLGFFSEPCFSFIYSAVTFQNIAPSYTKKYIQEFLRILVPGGLIVFEISSDPKVLRHKIKTLIPAPFLNLYYRLKYRGRPRIELHRIKRSEMTKFLKKNGARVIDIEEVPRTLKDYTFLRYCVTRD